MATLGPYVVGTRPPPLVVTFEVRNAANVAVVLPLPGYAAKFIIHQQGEDPIERDADVDETNNTATYTWQDSDFDARGSFQGRMWVGNGTLRLPSEIYEWDVENDIISPPPNI